MRRIDNDSAVIALADTVSDYHFRDGIRRIDFILVHVQHPSQVEEEVSRAAVNSFITKMERLGLQFETELASMNSTTTFIKVHAPLDVLYYHAKVHSIRLEMYNTNMQLEARESAGFSNFFWMRDDNINNRIPSETLLSARPKEPTICERIVITHKIMNSYDDNSGYQMLLGNGHLHSAYPLHDGDYKWSAEGTLNDRQVLNKYWSSFSMIFKKQPLDLVNRYFGSSIAFYFSWMEFYIKALFTIVLFGVATTIYSWATVYKPVNTKSDHYCKSTHIICAKCPHFETCPFTFLNASCASSRWNYLLENDSVIFNAILLSIWGTLYFVFWRRFENTLSYRWNLFNLKTEVTFRAQYPRETRYRRISPYTHQLEPYTPKRVAVASFCVAFCVMSIMVLLVIVLLVAVIFFRVYAYRVTDPILLLTDVHLELRKLITGSALAVVFILIFEMASEVICLSLVKFVNPPTNKAYDQNLVLKMFGFGFVNSFSHLFYVSFVKSQFYSHPGFKYSTYFSMMKTDLCDVNDCLLDVCIQLMGIVLATSLLRTSREIIGPSVLSWFRYRIAYAKQMYDEPVRVWERDFYKSTLQRYNLVFSYKHIMLQYGYITLFAAAFPLTPLFSLAYNLIEIRADAIKLIRVFRRPLPYRKKGIGEWNTILRFMAMISVTTNTLIISFTSDFVERIISEGTAATEAPHALSTFATEDYADWTKNKHKTPFPDLKECLYFADRRPANGTRKYEQRLSHIFVVSSQLIVFLLLEHVILFLITFVEMIVPQMPTKLEQQMHKERLLVIEKQETEQEVQY